ncbi:MULTISPECIES: HEAT repeat domain-containing protein [Streptomyces]|uniref:HEAT repeat domain-containing protein n=1 Tax=Streptomyces TaxID=1883 RepID=UPI000939C488|nr:MULTISPECIES: HEAT repeat domain-containing protein [unclassified Streptomyces]OKJ06950.1 PBS lyase [Streptomyces sp. TSRI0261]QNQ38061.1 HEAT repeat domain-containing protein [Streptomyces sp. CB00271]
MTTPPDMTITDALDRADAALLARRLDARTCPPDLLGRMVRHPAPRIRYLGLTLLAERADTPGAGGGEGGGEAGAGHLDLVARLLPDSPGASPEESLLLAGLHARLGAGRSRHRLPDWRAAALPARVRIAWLRTELLGDPTVLRTEPVGELLYRAVRGSAAAEAHRPDRLVAELVGTGDPVLGTEALRLARDGLHAGLLAPAFMRGLLVRLLDAPDRDVVTGALRELAEPWATVTPLDAPALTRRARALDGRSADRDGASAALAAAALVAAARHGHPTVLWSTAEDPAGTPALRGQAVELLGDRAERTDVGRLVALAATDPLLLAGPVLTCLRGLHRRGHFPADPDVGPLLALALADHTLPAEDVATVLYTCRRPLFDALTDAPPTAPDWPRRLELLIALSRQGAADIPIGEAVARLLPAARAPRPFLAAIRVLRPPAAEEAVLALLPTAPSAALDALEAIGGDRTRSALARAFGLGGPADRPPTAPDGPPRLPVAPELRPVRDRALALLWHLTREPGQRQELLARLDPRHLPYDIEADLGAPDERELAVLRARVDVDAPVAAFCRIAAYAGAATPPPAGVPLADLLLRIVRDLAAPRDPAEGPPRPGADTPNPGGAPLGPARAGGEPELPPEVVEAVRAHGSRLRRRRRIRPVCLLDAPDDTGAGHAFLTATLLGLLERPGLTGGERAVLLKALLQVPATPSTRARVHRLLRDRDPHVRKHVIALLAHDASGEDARALSATLVPLTSDPDIRTVRAALLALGAARARWAAEAVAARLHHPNMNIRKTAAATLLRAGSPAAVPHLLRALGRDDNPGLRSALEQALRAVVGPAYAATLLAAAEAARDERARRLLLSALDHEVTARAVLALDRGASPAVPALLALVADGGVRLSAGSVEDLAEPLARHGVPTPPAAPDGPPDGADPEVAALLRSGWDPVLALRIARRPAPPDTVAAHERPAARALLDPWLGLAGSTAGAGLRARLLRCALRLCPGPWSAEEVTVLARHAGTVTDAFDAATGGGAADGAPGATAARAAAGWAGELTDVLHAVAPHLSVVQRFTAVEGLRALPPTGPDDLPRHGTAASALTLLRRLGAVLVRADLDRALATAHLGADPWSAAPAVLREAFRVPAEQAIVHQPAAWRAELTESVRTPEALAEFRGRAVAGPRRAPGTDGVGRTPTAPTSRELLSALVEAYPGAAPGVRGRLVDWMTALQPLDAPEWTIAETRAARACSESPACSSRPVRADDLDQPRSAAQRSRLLDMLDAKRPDRRTAAARALLDWPEPGVARAVLRAYLRGRVDVLPATATLDLLAHPENHATDRPGEGGGRHPAVVELTARGVLPERALRWAARLPEDDLLPLVPLSVGWWEHGSPAVREAARTTLHHVPADALAHLLAPRVEAGDLGLLDLLAGVELLRTPELTRAERRLRTEGRDDRADALVLVDGPLRTPGAGHEDAAALDALRTPFRNPAAPADRPSPAELLDLARTGTPERTRQALSRLVEERAPASGAAPGPELHTLVEELLRHPRAGVRLHAHRASRALFDRDTHARLTVLLLSDPSPDVVRMAARTLGRAAWEPALPDLVRLLDHAKPVVRKAARDALVGFGGAAVPVLRRTAAHARPDRRPLYTDVLAEISGAGV